MGEYLKRLKAKGTGNLLIVDVTGGTHIVELVSVGSEILYVRDNSREYAIHINQIVHAGAHFPAGATPVGAPLQQ